jgi:hypothetical protein
MALTNDLAYSSPMKSKSLTTLAPASKLQSLEGSSFVSTRRRQEAGRRRRPSCRRPPSWSQCYNTFYGRNLRMLVIS